MGLDGATKILNINNIITNVPDPHDDNDSVNLHALNTNILEEVEVNNQLESLKYLRRDGENQTVVNLQMNGNKIVELTDVVEAADNANQGFPTFSGSRTTWAPRNVNACHFFQNN